MSCSLLGLGHRCLPLFKVLLTQPFFPGIPYQGLVQHLGGRHPDMGSGLNLSMRL